MPSQNALFKGFLFTLGLLLKNKALCKALTKSLNLGVFYQKVAFSIAFFHTIFIEKEGVYHPQSLE